jgi:hypothetical protein
MVSCAVSGWLAGWWLAVQLIASWPVDGVGGSRELGRARVFKVSNPISSQ